MHRLYGEKHFILLGLTQFLSQVCEGDARSRKSWRQWTSEGKWRKVAELKRKKMTRRRKSIAEGNKDYSYLAGPTSTPINKGVCNTRHIDDLLSAHTLTHTLGKNGNFGVVKGF